MEHITENGYDEHTPPKKWYVKTASTCLILISIIAGAALCYAGWVYGRPLLKAELDYAKNKPTIDSVLALHAAAAAERDSLQRELVTCTKQFELSLTANQMKTTKIRRAAADIEKYKKALKALSEMSDAELKTFLSLYGK